MLVHMIARAINKGKLKVKQSSQLMETLTEHTNSHCKTIQTRTFQVDNINVDDVAQKQRSNF